MTDSINIKKDKLSLGQKELLDPLKGLSEDGFVLYGGTALSLHCAHRESEDFDFFTEKPLEVEKLYKKFDFLEKSEVIQRGENNLVVIVPQALTPLKCLSSEIFRFAPPIIPFKKKPVAFSLPL